jgi:hypothetical protein
MSIFFGNSSIRVAKKSCNGLEVDTLLNQMRSIRVTQLME